MTRPPKKAQRHFIDRVQAIEQEALTYEKPRLASLTHKGDAENPLLGPVTDADRIKAMVAFFQANPDVLKLVTANMKLLK